MGGKGGDGGGGMYMPPAQTYSIDPATGWMIDDSGDVYELEGGGGGGSDYSKALGVGGYGASANSAFGGGKIKRYVGRKSELAELGGTPKKKPEKVTFDPGKPPVYRPPAGGGLPPPTTVPEPRFTSGGGSMPPQQGLGDAIGSMWTGAPMRRRS